MPETADVIVAAYVEPESRSAAGFSLSPFERKCEKVKAELTKDGWLNLIPETQEEFDVLSYMHSKSGVFRTNGVVSNTRLGERRLGNASFRYIATAGWTFDKGFIDRMMNK